LRRQIDIHREELKAKIDEIALGMIEKAKKQESEFYQDLKETHRIKDFNFEDEKQNLDEIFRNVDLTFDQIKQLKLDSEIGIKSLQAKMIDLNGLKVEIEKCNFNENNKFHDEKNFGVLNLERIKPKQFLVSGSSTTKRSKYGI
jgi:hypothetical protein